jgi:hypothetical protein
MEWLRAATAHETAVEYGGTANGFQLNFLLGVGSTHS